MLFVYCSLFVCVGLMQINLIGLLLFNCIRRRKAKKIKNQPPIIRPLQKASAGVRKPIQTANNHIKAQPMAPLRKLSNSNSEENTEDGILQPTKVNRSESYRPSVYLYSCPFHPNALPINKDCHRRCLVKSHTCSLPTTSNETDLATPTWLEQQPYPVPASRKLKVLSSEGDDY